jgi:AcrR family transcriptional regulator
MEAGTPIAVQPGLRERKKQKTRETIASVALELFAEQGYEHTTIAEIAEAAEISPRTIFTYFPSKEDILFCDMPEAYERFERGLRERAEGVTTLDVVREFLVTSLSPDRTTLLRKRVFMSEESLQVNRRARFAPFEQLLVEAIAQDLDTDPDDIRPRIVAVAFGAAITAVHDPAAPPEAFSPEHAMALIDDVLVFVQGGLDALRER